MQLADVARGARNEEIRARSAQLREALAAAEGARTLAKTAREAYERPTHLRAGVDTAEAQLASARASYEAAQAQQEEAIAGPRSQEVAQAEAALQQAEAALLGAESELAQVQRAYDQRLEADTQVTAAETELEVSRAAAEAAEAKRDLVEAPPRPHARDQIVERIAGARAALDQATDNLERIRTLYEAEAATEQELEAAETGYEQAVAGLSEAEAALADLDAGARDMERRQAEAGLAQATAASRGAARSVENARREQTILEATTRQQLERARSGVAQARHARDQAAAALDLALEGTRREKLRQAAAQVDGAEAGVMGAESAVENAAQIEKDRFELRSQLENATKAVDTADARVDAAKAQLDLALAGATDEALEMARGQVMQAEAALDGARARLADTEVVAPTAGTISEVILREGEAVNPGSVIVRMLDLDNLWVRIYLPLIQFGKISLGQPCDIYSDAYPGDAYPGTVQTVADESEFTPRNTQTKEERVKEVFWVKVDVGDGEGELKPGMPVDVAIDTGDSQ
jgi:HlyD family secretion protein